MFDTEDLLQNYSERLECPIDRHYSDEDYRVIYYFVDYLNDLLNTEEGDFVHQDIFDGLERYRGSNWVDIFFSLGRFMEAFIWSITKSANADYIRAIETIGRCLPSNNICASSGMLFLGKVMLTTKDQERISLIKSDAVGSREDRKVNAKAKDRVIAEWYRDGANYRSKSDFVNVNYVIWKREYGKSLASDSHIKKYWLKGL